MVTGALASGRCDTHEVMKAGSSAARMTMVRRRDMVDLRSPAARPPDRTKLFRAPVPLNETWSEPRNSSVSQVVARQAASQVAAAWPQLKRRAR